MLQLRQILNNEGFPDNKVRLHDVNYSKSKDECTLNFIYPEANKLSDDEKETITKSLAPIFRDVCKYSTNYHCSVLDTDNLCDAIQMFLMDEYKALSSVITKNDLSFSKIDSKIIVDISCDEITANILGAKGFIENLSNYLSNKFFLQFDININPNKATTYEDLTQNTKKQDTKNSLAWILSEEDRINKIEVAEVQTFYGKPIDIEPVFIAQLPHSDSENVACVGTVSRISTVKYQKKTANQEDVGVEKIRYSFTLSDPSGKVNVVMFPNDKDLERLSLIQEGQEVMVMGLTSTYNGNFNLRVKSISLCKILTKDWQYIYRSANDDYVFVRPNPIYEVTQMDLFSMGNAKPSISEYWNNHTVVMFDLETTGLDPNSCQIIEIGAVKIVNGACVETFQTLVNPKEPISAEITNITHITDEMVADAPTIDEVMPDFYKFVEGTTLSAYNISFDSQFLKVIGQKLRFKFDNEQIDALDLARRKIPSLHNYKLGTVVKALGIVLNDAHRALADAVAAAKVFIKLI